MGKSLPKRKRGKPSMQDPTPASAPYAPANKKCPANGVGDIATPSTNDSIGISSGGENCPVTSFDNTLDTHQPQVPSVPSSSYSTTVPNPEAPTTPTLPPNPIARHPRFLSRAPSPPPNLDGSIYIGRIISPGSIRLAAAGAPRVRPAIRFDETATSSRSSPEIGQDLPGGEVWPALKIGSADDFSAAAAAAAEAEQVSAAVAEKKAAVVASIRSILSSKSEWDARPLSSVHSISEEGTRDYFEEMGYPSDVASRNFDESFRFDNTLASNTAKLLSVSPASTAADPYTAAADFATARSMSACPSLSSVTTVTSPQEKDKYRKPLPRQGYRNLEASEPQLHQQEGTLQHVETKEIVVKENDGDVDVKYNQLPPLPSSKALTYDIASRLRAATRIEPTRFSSASGSSSSSHGETLIEVIDVDLLFADGVPLPESSRMKGVHLFVENEVIEVDDEGLDDDLEDLDDDDDEVEKVPPARVKPEPVLPKARCIRGSSASSDLTEVSSPQNRVAAMDLTTESAVSVPSQSNSLPPLKLAKPAGTGRWRFLEASDPPLRHGSPAPQGLELQDGCGAPHPAAWSAAGAVAPAAEGDNTWMEAPVQPEIPNWTGDATPWNGGVVTEPVDGDGRSLRPWQPPEVSAPSFCEQSGDAGWVGDDGLAGSQTVQLSTDFEQAVPGGPLGGQGSVGGLQYLDAPVSELPPSAAEGWLEWLEESQGTL
ncbi:hypothetical protein DFJ73DRAFT_837378 [Zopfochytrium polystomum]|nr:hypothetical protein DFJ73DRAFT_837378 [Zopfochytrium polystomum]